MVSISDEELRHRPFIVGDKLGHLSLSKDVLLNSLEEVVNCSHMVDQSPSRLIQIGMIPTMNPLGEHKLLRHKNKKVKTHYYSLP